MTDSEESAIDLENPNFKITPIQYAAASFCGSIITSFIVTPLDVVKIRLQAQQRHQQSAQPTKCFLYCNGLMDHICSCSTENFNKDWFQKPKHFTGTWDAIVKITRHEGITSLWSGLSPTLVLAIPSTVIYFVSYEQLRAKYLEIYGKNKEKSHQEIPFWLPGIAGSSARIITTSIINPLELVRTKMQSKKLTFYELRQALKVLLETDGVAGFWRGVLPHLLRDVPFSCIYWTTYESLKYNLSDHQRPSVLVCFFSGMIAGGLAASATTPFDVIKTHQQIDFGEKLLDDVPKAPKTSYQVCKEIIRNHSWRGMFAGLIPRIIKVAPACAIMISTFEYSKVFFYRLANQNENYSIEVNRTTNNILNR